MRASPAPPAARCNTYPMLLGKTVGRPAQARGPLVRNARASILPVPPSHTGIALLLVCTCVVPHSLMATAHLRDAEGNGFVQAVAFPTVTVTRGTWHHLCLALSWASGDVTVHDCKCRAYVRVGKVTWRSQLHAEEPATRSGPLLSRCCWGCCHCHDGKPPCAPQTRAWSSGRAAVPGRPGLHA